MAMVVYPSAALLQHCCTRGPRAKFLYWPLQRSCVLLHRWSLFRASHSEVSWDTNYDDSKSWKQILDRQWLLADPATKIQEVHGAEDSQFKVIRDDLLHPVMGGNKLRKLDALLPLFQHHGITDVVTCGGCQSAHAAAVAVACAESGIRAHLLLRGERPAIPTGYNLISGMYGYVTYIPRSEYSDRKFMLQKHAARIAGDSTSIVTLNASQLCDGKKDWTQEVDKQSMPIGSLNPARNRKRVAVLNEGAGDCFALPGLIRLVDYLSQPSVFGKDGRLHIVVDCGTGTTAIGLALGIALYGLSWQVVGVMLADNQHSHQRHADRLLSEFTQQLCGEERRGSSPQEGRNLPILWQERQFPRKTCVHIKVLNTLDYASESGQGQEIIIVACSTEHVQPLVTSPHSLPCCVEVGGHVAKTGIKFGQIFPREIEACQQIARQYGILLDPIYTLAGWEAAQELCTHTEVDQVALLHTGGTLGLFGLAQRYSQHFQ